MQFKQNSIAKNIIAGFVAFVLIVGVAASVSYAVSQNNIKKAQSELVSTIKGDLGEYLSDYKGIDSGTTGEISPDEEIEQELELTQDQIDLIVDSVTSTIEYSLIKDTISKYSSVSEESLAALKSNMEQQIESVLNSNAQTASLSATEKESIINTISSIVKYDMLDMMSEYSKNNTVDVATIQASLESDIAEVQSIVNGYSSKFSSLEAAINEVDKDSSNDLQQLSEKYTSLVSEFTTVQKSVDQMSTMGLSTLSARVTTTEEQIAKNTDTISSLIILLNGKYNTLSTQLQSTNTSLQAKVADISLQLKDYADNASNDAKTALLEDIALVKTDLATEISSATEAQKASLQTVYDELTAAQSTLASTDDVDELRDSLNTVATSVETNIASYQREVEAEFTKTNNSLASLETTMTTANAATTEYLNSLKAKVEALETKVADTETTLSGFSTNIASLTTIANANKSLLETLSPKVDTLESAVWSFTGRSNDENRYDPGKTYKEGDLCVYGDGNLLYKCLEETTGPWNSSKWEQTNMLSSLNENTNIVESLQEGMLKVQEWDEENKILYLYTP